MQHLQVESRVERDRRIPLRFGRAGAMREVVELIDHWPGETYCYFRVRARDGGVYILRHEEAANRWEIHSFESLPEGSASFDATGGGVPPAPGGAQ